MDLGGPVWHASGFGRTDLESRAITRQALTGVGDSDSGEWTELGSGGIFHIRRRLSTDEVESSGLTVRDIRGTDEQQQRLFSLLDDAPNLLPYLVSATLQGEE